MPRLPCMCTAGPPTFGVCDACGIAGPYHNVREKHVPLTPELVRQIVREEIERALTSREELARAIN